MHRAMIDGRIVTVEQFMARCGPSWRERGFVPTCPGCDATVHPYGAHSPGVTQRFDHDDRRDDDGGCPLSREAGRFAALKVHDLEPERAHARRARFFEGDAAAAAFQFVTRVTGGSCSPGCFAELVSRADRRRIWSYSGLRPWAAPFILLSLGDFVGRAGIAFHYVLRKGGGTGGHPWAEMPNAYLQRHFSDSGNVFTKGRYLRIGVTKSALAAVVGITVAGRPRPELTAALREAGLDRPAPPLSR